MTNRRRARMVAVTVRRSGGIGGIIRTWHADLPESDVPSLPAEGAETEPRTGTASGADRFVWTITISRPSAVSDDQPVSVDVPERRVDDGLRALIDRVRDEGTPLRPDRR